MKIFLYVLIAFTLFIACNSDDNCTTYESPYVREVNAPLTGKVNQDISIEVQFRVINGCGEFSKFIETSAGNIRTIEVEAKYEGCAPCTHAVETRIVNYIFNTQTAGLYVFKFKSGDSDFITVNITIE